MHSMYFSSDLIQQHFPELQTNYKKFLECYTILEDSWQCNNFFYSSWKKRPGYIILLDNLIT